MALPVISGHQVIKALTRAGFEVVGRKGSHAKLKKRVDEKVSVVIVPDHAELARGTMRSILRQANTATSEHGQRGIPEAVRGRLNVGGPTTGFQVHAHASQHLSGEGKECARSSVGI